MTELIYCPVFEKQPSDEYLERWREHIAATGCPETFENVSTTKPTQHENIVLLSDEIRVPVLLRPGGDRVPCSFCAPGSPKFIRGRMAYFPDEKAVRFIGHQCAATHFGENYQHAERLFRRQQRCREYFELWDEIASRRVTLVEFVDRMAAVASDLQFAREQFDTGTAKGFCKFLHTELAQTDGELFVDEDLGGKDRHGNVVIQRKSIGKAAGLKFLAEGYDVARDTRRLKMGLSDAERALPEWAPMNPEHPGTEEILKRGQFVEKVMRDMLATLALIMDGQEFLKRKHLSMLHRWGNRPGTPFGRFEIKADANQVLVRSDTYAGIHYANVNVPARAHHPIPVVHTDVAIIQKKVS